MICLTNRFSGTIGSAVTITVTVNTQTDTSKTLTFSAAPTSVIAFIPSSASPVLTGNITLVISPSFASALTTSDLTAYLENKNDETYKKRLNVIAVDNTAKTVTVKYSGAKSG